MPVEGEDGAHRRLLGLDDAAGAPVKGWVGLLEGKEAEQDREQAHAERHVRHEAVVPDSRRDRPVCHLGRQGAQREPQREWSIGDGCLSDGVLVSQPPVDQLDLPLVRLARFPAEQHVLQLEVSVRDATRGRRALRR